jgi:hypothetical protein
MRSVDSVGRVSRGSIGGGRRRSRRRMASQMVGGWVVG